MSEKTVLVTGGAGYIGSHVCKSLARTGWTPVTYDDLSEGHRWAVRWGPLEVGDIADGARLLEVMRRHRPVAVMHFAGFINVGESVADPGKYYRNNFAGSVSLLDAMRHCDVRHIVFSSTCATYGIPERQPIDEGTPQAPINPYGQSKLMVERALADFDRAFGLRSVALRYFNACGADAECETGEAHDPETHLIPRGLMAAAGVLPALGIYGTDYPTPDGTCIRDYIHVTDLAAGHLLGLRYLLDGGPSTAFNLGTGRGVSVREIVDSIERVTGRRVPQEFGPRRAGDPAVLLADPRRAASVLGFAPEYTQIDRTVETAWRWFERQRETNR